MSENEINKGKIYVAYITTLGIPELTYALAYVVDETSASGVKEVAQHASSNIGWAKQDIRRVYNLEKYKELFPQGYEMIDLDEITIHCRVGFDLCADLAIDEVRKAAGLKDQMPHREEKKESSERKTHAEIIAEMRYKMGVTCPWQVNGGTCELCPLGHSPHGRDLGKYCSFHKLANELDAAHKRELDDAAKEVEDLKSRVKLWTDRADELRKKCDEFYAKSKAAGDCAKLREAMLSIRAGILKRRSENCWYATDSDILEKIDAALAAPPRNCDVYTADELKVIFNSELVSELPIANEHEKNLITITAMRMIDTLFTTTKEGGNDENE